MKYEQVISRHPSVCESPKTPWCGGGTDVPEDMLQLVTCPLPRAASSASQLSLPQSPASERFSFTECWTYEPMLYWLAAAYGTSSTSGTTRNTLRTRDEPAWSHGNSYVFYEVQVANSYEFIRMTYTYTHMKE